jgi:hypothetical protein
MRMTVSKPELSIGTTLLMVYASKRRLIPEGKEPRKN